MPNPLQPAPALWIYIGPGLPQVIRGFPLTQKDEALIRSSIHTILGTQIGERLFIPQFGSRTKQLVFEPNDLILKNLAQQFIIEALIVWEPRISIGAFGFSAENDLFLTSFQFSLVRFGSDPSGMHPAELVIRRAASE